MTTRNDWRRQAWTFGVAAGIFGGVTLAAQSPAECPLHVQHQQEKTAASPAAAHDARRTDEALDQVDARGDQVMGFGHDKATHHFLLTAAGGAIEVSVNDADDEATRGTVRAHLKQVAAAFAAGDFGMPRAIHGRIPAGVAVMRAKSDAIAYRYRETAAGGRVELTGGDAEARAAIHAFLRFQILEHRTGDPLEPGQP